jgi:hypothetical protein
MKTSVLNSVLDQICAIESGDYEVIRHDVNKISEYIKAHKSQSVPYQFTEDYLILGGKKYTLNSSIPCRSGLIMPEDILKSAGITNEYGDSRYSFIMSSIFSNVTKESRSEKSHSQYTMTLLVDGDWIPGKDKVNFKELMPTLPNSTWMDEEINWDILDASIYTPNPDKECEFPELLLWGNPIVIEGWEVAGVLPTNFIYNLRRAGGLTTIPINESDLLKSIAFFDKVALDIVRSKGELTLKTKDDILSYGK